MKLNTLSISVQSVDSFFKKSVLKASNKVMINRIEDPFILLFVLFQDYTKISQIKFRGNLTEISIQRALETIDDLDVLLPKETPKSVNKIQRNLLALVENNQGKNLLSETVNLIIKKLRIDGNIWSDEGVAEFFDKAFEYSLEISLADLENLKQELAKVAHNDVRANYDEVLKIKRATDIEIHHHIYFRSHHNGKNDPACLLLNNMGANKFSKIEKLKPTEVELLDILFQRRFPRKNLLQETDTNSLSQKLGKSRNAVNSRKSELQKKVIKHLKTELFVQDTQGNITFPREFTCMSEQHRKSHQARHQF